MPHFTRQLLTRSAVVSCRLMSEGMEAQTGIIISIKPLPTQTRAQCILQHPHASASRSCFRIPCSRSLAVTCGARQMHVRCTNLKLAAAVCASCNQESCRELDRTGIALVSVLAHARTVPSVAFRPSRMHLRISGGLELHWSRDVSSPSQSTLARATGRFSDTCISLSISTHN